MSDVSCRAYTYFEAAAQAGLVDLDVLLEGCPLDRDVLENTSRRVPWDDWAVLCDRFVNLTGEAGLAASGDLMVSSELGGTLTRLNASIVRPKSLYQIARTVCPMLYRTVRVSVDDVSHGRVRVELEIPEPHRPSSGWLQMAARVLPALPRYLGLPDAVMVLEALDERRLRCVLTPPRSRTLWDRMRSMWAGVWRNDWVLEELDYHQVQLMTTYEALKRSEHGFRQALDALPEGVVILRAGGLVYANSTLTGWLDAEGRGVDLLGQVLPDGHEALAQLLDGRSAGPHELAFGRDARWLRVTGMDLTFEEHSARMLFCVDISAGRAAQAEAERGRQTLMRLSEAIPDLVMRVDDSGVLLDFIAGSDHDQAHLLEGLRGMDIVTVARGFTGQLESGFLDTGVAALERARATGVPVTTHARLRLGGERRVVEIRVIPSAGEVLLLIRDVTRRTRLEEQLAISERMASVGTLAAGVAHEINNPLTYVSANVQFVMDDLAQLEAGEPVDFESMREALSDALEGSDRVARIVQELKGFSRLAEQERQAVDLTGVVASALRLADNELRHRARVEQELGEAPLVEADPTKLVQVLVNLLVNAAQAIEPGDVEGNRVRVIVGVSSAGWPQVAVEDTGCGMSDEVARRVFDPFFTTKGLVGTGLGLAIAHRIVSDLGGTLGIESELGQGTRAVVCLPPAELVPQVPRRTEVAPRTPPSHRILVVDDDEPVARAVARMLAPHQVTLANDGMEALAVVEVDPPDLVLCDVMMPGMGGLELYRRLQERGLEGRIAFISGGIFSEEAQAFLEAHEVPLLLKPFRPDTLRQRVSELLGAS